MKSSIQKAINKDDKDDDDKRLSLQPRPVNDVSSLVRMMANMVKLNRRVDVTATVSRSQFTVNINRCPDVNYSDSTDDEDVIRYYYSKITHFSHPHNLSRYNFQHLSQSVCKVCGLQLVGSGYGCQSCQFYMHASCYDLPGKIKHNAHNAHPLTLRDPSYYNHCGKTCDACCENIERSFLYCCDVCDYDLHVTCAMLYSSVRSAGSILRLYDTVPVGAPCCQVCYRTVSKAGWSYYSKDDRRIAHINCAKGKLTPSAIKDRLNTLKVK